MHNLIEYSDNYSKKWGRLRQYYRDEPALNNVGIIIDFPNANNSASSKFIQSSNICLKWFYFVKTK